jgi:hypothetical protein
LYLTCTTSSAVMQPQKRELWLAFNENMCHTPLRAGEKRGSPLNLGTTQRMCKKLHTLLSSPEHRRTKIIFCTSTEAADLTNTVALLGAFLCLRMGCSVAQASKPFNGLHHYLINPFRDATCAAFDLHVGDCLAAIERAVSAGVFKQNEFCAEEYFHYDDPLHGDLHEVVPGKFIAFRGPVRDRWQKGTLERGESTLSASDYLDVFKGKNVSTIIRLNNIEYSAAVFKRAGFTHFDLPFEDCEVPSDRIVDEFLRIAEEARGVVAVHCLAGRGRTGSLIALYLMKHHGFTAREAMCWLQICRPGSILGPQQHYLEQQQSRMHMLGGQGCSSPDLAAAAELDHSVPNPTTSRIQPYAVSSCLRAYETHALEEAPVKHQQSCDEERSQLSAESSAISREMADDAASVVNSLSSRADTICGPEHVEYAARRVTNGKGLIAVSEEHSGMQDAHNSFLFAQSDLLLSYDDKLGEGSTGTVYRGIVCNEIEVAVKVIHASMTGTEKQQAIADLRQVFLPTTKP